MVTVMETPACCKVLPIFSAKDKVAVLGSETMLYQHSMMTNMSSIPIPMAMKGRTLCVWLYSSPRRKVIPMAEDSPMTQDNIPIPERYSLTSVQVILPSMMTV